MFSNRRFSIVASVAFAVCLAANSLCLANTVSLTWHKHTSATCPDATIDGWHSSSTTALKTDDDGAPLDDVACDTTLQRSGSVDTTWTYTGGDDVITSTTERTAAFAGMTRNCAVVSSISIGGSTILGCCQGHNKIIMTSGAPAITLAHEVGHKASLSDLNPTITSRIMNYALGGSENRVICTERDAFLGL